MEFFRTNDAAAAQAVNLTLAVVIDAVNFGVQRGTHANRRVVNKNGTGAATHTDMGAPCAIAIGGVLTLYTAVAQCAYV